jgi:peptide/nickel transport system substrate-binding protein
VAARDMRTRPIGTGPFKFVEFKPNESIRVTRNPDYWKKDRPYLDGIEYTIIPSISTRLLGFVAGKFDTVTGVTVPLLKDVKSQAPQAVCEVADQRAAYAARQPGGTPFDNRERRAVLGLDRVLSTSSPWEWRHLWVMLPAPEGVWGCRPTC